MSDTKSGDDKTLSVTPKKTLSLKPGGVQQQSTVRQNFSHGRTKNVVVETKKRRLTKPDEVAPAATPSVAAGLKPRPAEAAPAAAAAVPSVPTPAPAEPRAAAETPAAAVSRPSGTSVPHNSGRPPQIQLGPKPGSQPKAEETVAEAAPAAPQPVADEQPVAPQAATAETPKAAEPAQAAAPEAAAPEPAAPVAATPAEAVAPVVTPAPAASEAPAPQAQTSQAPAAPQAPRAAAPSAPRAPSSAPAGRTGAPYGNRPGSSQAPRSGGAPDRGAAGGNNRPGQGSGQGRPGGRDDRRPAPAAQAGARQPRGAVLSDLSSREMDARRRALELARQREVEDRRLFQLDEARRIADDERRQREMAESEARQAEEAARLEAEAAARRKAEAESQRRVPARGANASATPASPADAEAAAARTPVGERRRRVTTTEEDDSARARIATGPRRAPAKPATTPEAAKPARPGRDDGRRSGKLTLDKALSADEGARGRSLSAIRRRQEKFKRSQQNQPREKISREVIIPETISIQELANRMSERSVDVIKFLMAQGQMMKPGDIIDADLAELIASEFGHTVRRVAESDVEEGIFNAVNNPDRLASRPPVVTIMGHVDHGKTSLLDAIRQTKVVSGEAGGITQHIGAYQVEHDGHKISFIDTPGHEAFTAMRARGAKVTDIAILVVAADDSVMPQTIESINHAKAAGVPIIVAINKIDKPSADAQKVRTQLLQHEVFVESMGGEVLDVEVSATKGINLDGLLEAVLLQAEVLDLKSDPERPAEGSVIEAQLDKGRGPVATVLVQAGTLRQGDIIVAGDEWGRVRALVTDKGKTLKEAGPSMPIEVLGMQGTPQAGDRFAVVENEAKAREISEYRQRLSREKQVAKNAGQRGSLEQMMSQLQDTGRKEFPLLIKGDVQGSIEAIVNALDKLGTDEVRARIIHSGAGAITESDISLAAASNAAIIGFNVRANTQARQAADRDGIDIRYYNIIYNLVDDVKDAMSGLLSPERRETFLGNAEILEVFQITKVGKVAGCRVTEGKVERGAGVRLIRDNVVIHEGTLKTLKRFKDEVSEVYGGQECGMAFQNYEDIRQGDVIECFRVEHVARKL
ncbi:translation initiation factor IF-2 [Aurantimonas sp. Leaf443]|uniref:translation initiation factor IF-2 n=1 Tax=Aurantimonas sp. Leaf443 TaxID=1736378 RepID=UPI0006F79B01|nr:translation initiation factor IF-2 [Aurantimonas sp. Leaf443]KQT83929.1 translation initiation factor IF-2 [Aurantimonas sp. Leaf443]